MKTNHHHPKLKTQPRPLFSCGFFRNCTQSTLSPTAPRSPSLPPTSPPLPHPSPPPPPPPPAPPKNSLHQRPESSSSSSSSSASHSFTQWKFPIPTSPLHQAPPQSTHFQPPPPPPPPLSSANLQELFHLAELQISTGSLPEQLAALQLLERSLVPNPPSDPICSPELMRGIVSNLKNKAGVKPATKILLALCLAEGNRRIAVEAGAVCAVVEVAMELEGAAAERALAALELMCTVAEGAAEVRTHALAVPVMVSVMGRLAGRGREYAISVISVIYGGGCGDYGNGNAEKREEDVMPAPPEEVARAVALALQGECTARGRRKGAQLLKILEEYGRLNLTQDGNEGF